jgi:glycosyltransferase involved in cell wall biosynthesis
LARAGADVELVTSPFLHGRVPAAEDPEALAAALTELLSDRAERERLEAGARTAAERPYSWDTVAAQHVALYRELTSG